MAMYRCNCGEWVSVGTDKEHKCPSEPFNVLVNRLKVTNDVENSKRKTFVKFTKSK